MSRQCYDTFRSHAHSRPVPTLVHVYTARTHTQTDNTDTYEFCSVLFFSCPQSEGWPHHGRTSSFYLCPLSFCQDVFLHSFRMSSFHSRTLLQATRVRMATRAHCELVARSSLCCSERLSEQTRKRTIAVQVHSRPLDHLHVHQSFHK